MNNIEAHQFLNCIAIYYKTGYHCGKCKNEETCKEIVALLDKIESRRK